MEEEKKRKGKGKEKKKKKSKAVLFCNEQTGGKWQNWDLSATCCSHARYPRLLTDKNIVCITRNLLSGLRGLFFSFSGKLEVKLWDSVPNSKAKG